MSYRRHSATTTVAFAVGVLISMSTAQARRQDSLPAPRDVVARHVAAIGGEAAYGKVKSIRARGRLQIPAQGISGDLELLSARPARVLYRVTVPGIGRIENGYNGTVGWSLSPLAGPELLSGRQLTETADDAWFDGHVRDAGHVRDLVTLARTEFDGHAAYQIKVVYVSGNEQTEYFDLATGFQIGSEAPRATPNGVVQTVNILRDYKKFGALMQATTFIQRALGFEQVITLNSFEYDVVPAAAFDPPAEVKALIAR